LSRTSSAEKSNGPAKNSSAAMTMTAVSAVKMKRTISLPEDRIGLVGTS
jgi:hypothetical protein